MLYFVGSFAIYYNVLKKKSQTRSIYIILPVILSTESYLRGFFKKTTQTQYLIQGEKNISLRGHGELFFKIKLGFGCTDPTSSISNLMPCTKLIPVLY